MGSKKSITKIKPTDGAEVAKCGPPSVFDRQEPITLPQKLAVCYMNRPHDSLAGVPYHIWMELSVWLWDHPNGIDCTCPNMIGVRAPDAIPLPVESYLSEIDGHDRSKSLAYRNKERVVWIYPKS